METKQLSFEELTAGINTFEDVCARLSEKSEDVLPHANPTTIRQHVDNDNARLDYVAQYLKQGSTENYYFPIFYNDNSGFGFSRSRRDYWSTYSDCGSRLWQPNIACSDFFGQKFVEIHKRLLTNNY